MDHFPICNSLRYAKISAICLALVLTGCEEQDPEVYIKEGKALFVKDELESARLQFQNALQLNPELPEAYFNLALVAEKKQVWGVMIRNLLDTLTIDSTHLQAHIKLGQIYLLGQKYQKAEEQAQAILELDPENITGRLMIAAVRLRQGENEFARQSVEKVLLKKPNLVNAIALKVAYLTAEKRNNEALEILKEGITQNIDNRELRLLKVRIDMDAKRFDDAVNEYNILIDQNPEDVSLRLPFTELLLFIGRQDEAEQHLRAVINKDVDNIDLKLKLVGLAAKRGGKQAEVLLKEFISISPDQSILKFQLADYLILNDRVEEASVILQEIASLSNTNTDALTAKVKLANIAIQQKDSIKMTRLVEEILQSDANHSDGLILRSGMRLNQGNIDGAVADLRVVLSNRPDSEQALVLQAKANSLKGEKEVAESLWRKILQIHPNNRLALTQVINTLQKREDYEQAEKILLKAQKSKPNDIDLVELQIKLKLAEKDLEGALEGVSKLATMQNTKQLENYWQGVIAALKGKNKEAIKKYKSVLKVQPDNGQVLNSLAQIYQKNDQRSELLSYLTNHLSNNGKSSSATKMLALIYRQDKKWQLAENIIQAALRNNPEDIELKLELINVISQQSAIRAETILKEWVQAYPTELQLKSALADLYTKQQRYIESDLLFTEIVNAAPQSVEGLLAQVKLAELAWIKSDEKTALALLEKIIDQSPWYNNALMMRASIFLALNKYSEAEIDLKRVLENKIDFKEALLMLARVYQNQGKTDKVNTTWRRVLDLNPDHLAALKYLTQQYIKTNDWEKAENMLNKAFQTAPENTSITELIIQLHATKQDWGAVDEAIARLQKQSQGQVIATLWQARFSVKKGGNYKAISLYKHALNKNPENKMILMALRQLSQQLGKQAELISYLKLLIQKNPEIDSLYHVLALTYTAEKKWVEAEKLLKQQLKRNTKDINAYILLARLYQSQNKQIETESTFLQGLAVLTDDLQLMNELAKFYIVKQDYSKAIRVYESVIKKYPDNNEATNNLADLLITHQGHNQKRIEQAMQLVKGFQYESNAVMLDNYGWVQLKAGNTKVALEALQKSVDKNPNDARVLYHLAEAYQQVGDTKNAQVELEKSLSLIKGRGEFVEVSRAKELRLQLLGMVE